MNQFYLTLLAALFINFVYLFSKFWMAIKLGVHDEQLFLGFGKHEAFKIQFKKLTIYVGLFIPLPWLAKFYRYEAGKKEKITFEWEFSDKPLGVRLAVIFAGSLGCFIASMLIFCILPYQAQDQYLSKEELNKFGIYPSELARSFGFKKGDRVLKINREDYSRFADLLSPTTILEDSSIYQIAREQDTLVLRSSWDMDQLSARSSYFFTPNAPHEIIGLSSGLGAEVSGMMVGDIITKVETVSVSSMQEICHLYTS